MKGKLLKGISLVCMLTMLFSVTVLAAPSTQSNTTDATPKAVNTTAYAAGVTASVDGANVTLSAVTQSVINSAVAFGSSLGSGASLLFCVDVKADKGGVATFANSGIVSGMKLRAGHMKADGSWEEYKIVEVGNGYVKIQCPSFSPIAVFSVSASPKTGETVPVALLIALASLFGMCVCVKKVRLEQ